VYVAHTHTHTHLTALCPGLPGSASTRKVKPIWILLEQETVSGSGHQLGDMQVCISLQTDNHTSTSLLNFFTGRMYVASQKITICYAPLQRLFYFLTCSDMRNRIKRMPQETFIPFRIYYMLDMRTAYDHQHPCFSVYHSVTTNGHCKCL